MIGRGDRPGEEEVVVEVVVGDVGVNVEVEDLELEVMGVEVEVIASGPWWSA